MQFQGPKRARRWKQKRHKKNQKSYAPQGIQEKKVCRSCLNFADVFVAAKTAAKGAANLENENEIEYETENNINNKK